MTETLKKMLRILPDTLYLRFLYCYKFGKRLSLKEPKTFNEKIQWLKLHDRDPKYTRMADKYEAKTFVAEQVGKEYTVPTYGVWDNFDEIEFDKLPDRLVLKTTHDSGGVVICRNKTELDMEKTRKLLETSLGNNYYWDYREWPYKNIRPRILAEEYLHDENTNELRDYKFYTFSGKVKAFLIVSGRNTEAARGDYFYADGRHMDLEWGFSRSEVPPALPENYEKMVQLAQELSQGTHHLRVDFFEVNGRVYVGELTFYDGGGFQPMTPEKYDTEFGKWLQLPECRK